ncbi:ankyrin repeat domain-containing protein [Streptomyces sp. NPDC056486]|uniref:ankyrin repeat domain-containing protein n=1 Tax=Streptomyces sp. NPDC056486 TaxID=3345835 RepID=UPI00368FFDBE
MNFTEVAEKLFHGAATGDENQVVKILASGVSPDLRDTDRRRTPLDLAVWNNHPGVVKILLDAGADPNVIAGEYGETTALRYAAPRGMLEVAQYLLDAGARPDGRLDDEQATPLMLAAGQGELGMTELLLKRGASPNLATEQVSPVGASRGTRVTALSSAATGGHLATFRLLLDNGARPDEELLKLVSGEIERKGNGNSEGRRENLGEYHAIKKLIEETLRS